MHNGVVPLLYGSLLLMVGVTQGQGELDNGVVRGMLKRTDHTVQSGRRKKGAFHESGA